MLLCIALRVIIDVSRRQQVKNIHRYTASFDSDDATSLHAHYTQGLLLAALTTSRLITPRTDAR